MTKRNPVSKRAVLYIRVSTQGQADEGVSMEAQEAALRAYCTLRGLDVAHVVADPAQSAFKPLAKRTGGKKVLDLVKRGEVTNVIVYKLDRAFRNAADCLAVVGAWDAAGVSLHLVDMGGQAVDTSSAMGRFFLTVMAGAAELERNQVAERTSFALAHKASTMGKIGGHAPFGYAYEDDVLVSDEREQATIAVARSMREAGISLRATCAQLAEKGLYNRAGNPFFPEQIERMLRGPARPVPVA